MFHLHGCPDYADHAGEACLTEWKCMVLSMHDDRYHVSAVPGHWHNDIHGFCVVISLC